MSAPSPPPRVRSVRDHRLRARPPPPREADRGASRLGCGNHAHPGRRRCRRDRGHEPGHDHRRL
jgi:hypothetical protein